MISEMPAPVQTPGTMPEDRWAWIPRVLRQGSVLAWHHLLTLLWLNVLWVVCVFTVVLAGPATLTLYRYVTAQRDDLEPRPRDLWRWLKQLIIPGLLWALVTGAFAFLVYANLSFWPNVAGPFGSALAWMLWGYLIWLFITLQPYLLERLAVERRPFLRAWPLALANVARQHVSAHLWVLIPLSAFLIGQFLHVGGYLILVSLVLLYAAVQVKPVAVRPPAPDDSFESDAEEEQA